MFRVTLGGPPDLPGLCHSQFAMIDSRIPGTEFCLFVFAVLGWIQGLEQYKHPTTESRNKL